MTASPTPGMVVRVRAQPDVYTVMLVVAILVLAATIGIVLYDLAVRYGMTFQEIFTGKMKGLPV